MVLSLTVAPLGSKRTSWPSAVVTPTIFSFPGSFTTAGSNLTVFVTLQSVSGVSRVKMRAAIKKRQVVALKPRARLSFAKRRVYCMCSSSLGGGESIVHRSSFVVHLSLRNGADPAMTNDKWTIENEQ